MAVLFWKTPGLCLAAACLAGCATAPPPGQAVLAPAGLPEQWQSLPPASQAPAAALGPRWWTVLGDATLDRLVQRADDGAPDLRTAALRLREARSREKLAAANRGPSVSAEAQASRSQAGVSPSSGSSLWSLGLDASWEIDLFGRLAAGDAAARADAQAAAEALAYARVTLRAEVVRQYLALRSLQRRAAVAGRSADSQAQTLQLSGWRVQAGLASVQERDQAQASLDSTRAQQQLLLLNAELARQQLELLLGLPAAALLDELASRVEPGDDLPSLAALPPQSLLPLPAELLRQRPDVRQAALQWLAESGRSEQARANLLPRLNLSGSIGLQALSLAGLAPLGDALRGSLLAGLSAPLFDAGRLRATLDIQQAVQDRYAEAYAQAVLTALSEVETALATLAGRQRQTALLAEAAQAAGRAATLAQARWRGGLIDFASVLETERSRLSAEDSLAAARGEALAAWVALAKAIAAGAEPPSSSSASPAAAATGSAP